MTKYDLFADSVIDDFENWLREHPQGVWYACDPVNCPWRAFVRDRGYEVVTMWQYYYTLSGDNERYRNPVFAQDFIETLDHSDGTLGIEPFEVGVDDCLKALHRVKRHQEEEKKRVQFRNGIPANH